MWEAQLGIKWRDNSSWGKWFFKKLQKIGSIWDKPLRITCVEKKLEVLQNRRQQNGNK